MTTKMLQIIGFVSLMMNACDPPATFTEPQPAHQKALKKIPEKLQGSFLSATDTSVLIISSNFIVRKCQLHEKRHLSQLDSNWQLEGDTSVLNTENGERYMAQITGDSIFLTAQYADTLLNLTENDQIKKYKGYFFLNIFRDDGAWEVKKVEAQKNKLTISAVSAEEDLDKLLEITETVRDTAQPQQFTLSKKQFKEFIKREGFDDQEVLYRMKTR